MTMGMQDKKLGRSGETLAVEFLKGRGYCILEKNFRAKVGEIDIIAKDGDTICFVEVKTRAAASHGSGFEAISGFKMRKLTQTAQWYLSRKNLHDINARFDVVSISVTEDHKPRIQLLQNAFEAVGD